MPFTAFRHSIVKIISIVVVVVMLFCNNAAATTCGGDSAIGSSYQGGYTNGTRVIINCENCSGSDYWHSCPRGDNAYACRVTATGTGSGYLSDTYHYAGFCGPNNDDTYHTEYQGSCIFECVKNTGVYCKNIYQIAFEGGTNPFGYTGSAYTKANQSGTASFSIADGDTATRTRAWNTSSCKFDDVSYIYDNCSSGVIKWSAEPVSVGNAADGFSVKYIKNNATYNCSTCKEGYKKINNGVYKSNGQKGCECRTAEHWKCPTSGDAYCFPGYQQNGSGSTASCDKKPHYHCFGDYSNTCVCKYGFGGTDCNSCKANFQLVSASDQENDSCVCPDGYIQSGQDTPDDPEDDTCVIDTNTTYNDSTGWFTVGPNGSSCNTSGNWWEQQN